MERRELTNYMQQRNRISLNIREMKETVNSNKVRTESGKRELTKLNKVYNHIHKRSTNPKTKTISTNINPNTPKPEQRELNDINKDMLIITSEINITDRNIQNLELLLKSQDESFKSLEDGLLKQTYQLRKKVAMLNTGTSSLMIYKETHIEPNEDTIFSCE